MNKIRQNRRPTAVFALAALAAIALAQEKGYDISSFNPKSGPPGTVVTLDGSGLGAKTTSVTINGVAASFTATQVYEIKVTIPPTAATGPITLTGTPGTISTAQPFTVTTSGGTTGGGGGTTTSNIVNPPPHINPPSTALQSHPRMWVRQTDIPRLRGWASNPNNKVWTDLLQVANFRKTQMIQGKIPQLDDGDGEGNAYPYAAEEAAELFAFMSMVDPNATARADWAQRAHDLMVYIMNNAVLGPASNQKYRSPHFATYNRSRWYGEAFPLVVDWCYDTFTAAEKATIRKVFIRWTHEILDYNITGGGYTVAPSGVVNSPSLTASKGIRWAGNNYWCNHARNIAMMSLALDPADDVPAAAGDYTSGYLRDYIGNAIGAWMYVRNYAETHDLAGGLSPEGAAYSESSFSALTMMMLALHTAGYDDPAVYGPAVSMSKNSFWTQDAVNGYLHSLSPVTDRYYTWAPMMYLPAGYGDVLRYETIDMIRAFGPLAAIDIADGNLNSTRLNAIKWIQTWMSPGGPSYMDTRLTTSPSNYGTMLPIMYFLTFDPTANMPADPHIGMPTDFVSPGLNRLLSRTDWGPNASWFSFISTWNNIDHQWGDSNSFSFYRKGEWLTKEWSGYGKNIACTDYQNNVSIENPPVSTLNYVVDEGKHGSQFSYVSDGDPVVKTSTASTYAYAEGDATKRFNSTSQNATDVQHASRSILYMKPDVVVVYDRADSKSTGRAKRFYMNFAKPPVQLGANSATFQTPKGQNIFVSCLLPATATVKYDQPTTTWGWNESTAEEPMHFRFISEDLQKPKSVRFLHIVQGADGGATAIPSTAIHSTSGAAYDGAIVGNSAVLFAVNLGQAFSSMTYSVPSGTTTHYVTGLTPGAGYTVDQSVSGGTTTITISAGGSTIADAAGLIRF